MVGPFTTNVAQGRTSRQAHITQKSQRPRRARAGVAGYNCGHGTITRVLRKLADEGLVHAVPRWGVFAGPADSQD